MVFFSPRKNIVKNLKISKKNFQKKKTKKFSKKFKKNTVWNKKDVNEGGGQYFILKNGQVFDQVGVNLFKSSRKISKNFKSNIPGANKNPNYWASGISVVAHMKNPKFLLFILIQDLLLHLKVGLVEEWM